MKFKLTPVVIFLVAVIALTVTGAISNSEAAPLLIIFSIVLLAVEQIIVNLLKTTNKKIWIVELVIVFALIFLILKGLQEALKGTMTG